MAVASSGPRGALPVRRTSVCLSVPRPLPVCPGQHEPPSPSLGSSWDEQAIEQTASRDWRAFGNAQRRPAHRSRTCWTRRRSRRHRMRAQRQASRRRSQPPQPSACWTFWTRRCRRRSRKRARRRRQTGRTRTSSRRLVRAVDRYIDGCASLSDGQTDGRTDIPGETWPSLCSPSLHSREMTASVVNTCSRQSVRFNRRVQFAPPPQKMGATLSIAW
jgi:hypothetical protein